MAIELLYLSCEITCHTTIRKNCFGNLKLDLYIMYRIGSWHGWDPEYIKKILNIRSYGIENWCYHIKHRKIKL